MYLCKFMDLFIDIATQHKLKYEIKSSIDVEIICELSRQLNLKFNILLCLQNNDMTMVLYQQPEFFYASFGRSKK